MNSTLLKLTFGLSLISNLGFSQSTNTVNISKILPSTRTFLDNHMSLDVYGAVPLQQCGWGFGFGLFGPGTKVGNITPTLPLHIRFGGEFYFAEMAHRQVGTLPLNAPQSGDAKIRVSQNTLGLNGIMRISMPLETKFTPYVDLFCGFRNFGSGMSITPLQKQEGYEESTSKNLTNSSQFCYGGTAGVLVYCGKYVRFNTGLMYTTSNMTGQITDLTQTRIESGNLVTQTINTPKNMLILKVGFTFIIDGDDRGCREDDVHCGKTYRSSGGYSNGGIKTGGNGGSKANKVNVKVKPRT
jgi:hypothetical protein